MSRNRPTKSTNINSKSPCLVSNEELLAAIDAESQDPTSDSNDDSDADGATSSSVKSGRGESGNLGNGDGILDETIDISSNNEESGESDSDCGEPTTSKRSRTTCGPKGKAKDVVWEEFTTLSNGNGKIISNKCKRCGNQVSSKACRMRKHLQMCRKQKKLPVDATVRFQNSPASSPMPPHEKEAFPSTEDIRNRMKIWNKASALKAQDEMDKLIGKMIFSANLPFSFSANPFLEELVNKAQLVNYKPPNPQKVGGAILDAVYDDCMESNLETFKDRKVVILQDGWSTNQNAPVICHSIHTGNFSLMFDTVETNTNKKDATYCFGLLEQAIKKAEKKFKCKVIGTATDNCNVMKSMRELANAKFEQFYTYGCVAHILNLCGQEMTDDNLVNNIVKVQKYFRNHHYESASLLAYKGHRPVMPGKTRWNSQIDTLESYIKNHLTYLRISREKESSISKHSELVEILNSGDVYAMAERHVAILSPVANALDKVQSNTCTLADAVDVWIKMRTKLPEEILESSRLRDKAQMIMTGVAISAFMLHPLYRGNGLSRNEEQSGFEELGRIHHRLAITASSLKARDDTVFPRHLLKEEAINLMSPTAWWRSVGAYTTVGKKVVEICENLMILPASTAALERSFSTMGNILTKKRNRLGVEKAGKLALIHKTLSGSNNEDIDECDINN